VRRRLPDRAGPLLLLCLALILHGCTVGPDYVPPETEVPDAWHLELVRGLSEGEADLQTWWTVLQDPLLDDLIRRASAGNLDLQQAAARILESQARLGLAQGERFPDLDGIGTAQRNRSSEEIVPMVPPPASRTDNFLALGVDSSWEIDFWGRITRSVESADAGLEASIEDYRDILVLLFAEVAVNYVDVRALQLRIQFAESNVETQRGALQLTIDRNRAGLVGDLDVRQAEQNLASTEAFIPTLRTTLAAAIHRLGVLVGEPPSALYGEISPQAPIPAPPQQILVGLPTDLLRQRPDVRRSERELAAQTAQIGVATADLYPRFALFGTFAFEGIRGNDLVTAANRAFVFGPSFRWNIFDGGRVRSNIRVEQARTEQALYRYRQSVLGALEDVENSMVSYVQERERRDALERSVVASREAVNLVDTLYRTGLTDFQNVLDTQRTQFLQEDDLAASEGLVTQNLIRIYRALGGGWSPAATAPTLTP
jgi:NodT family efflux transporter outer membrane factor (OMF) lipoprotein